MDLALKKLSPIQREGKLLGLVNPYGLDYGQPALRVLNQRYASEPTFKAKVDRQREQSSLPPWPVLSPKIGMRWLNSIKRAAQANNH